MPADVLLCLSTDVYVEGQGWVHLYRGDEIPEGADSEAVEKLRRFDAIGDPAKLIAAPQESGSDAQALADDEFAHYVAGSKVADLVKAVADDASLAQRVLDVELAQEKPRKGLVSKLEALYDQPPAEDEPSGDEADESPAEPDSE